MHNTNNIVSLRVKSTVSICRYLGKVTVTLNNPVLFHVLHDDITASQLVVGHHWKGKNEKSMGIIVPPSDN